MSHRYMWIWDCYTKFFKSNIVVKVTLKPQQLLYDSQSLGWKFDLSKGPWNRGTTKHIEYVETSLYAKDIFETWDNRSVYHALSAHASEICFHGTLENHVGFSRSGIPVDLLPIPDKSHQQKICLIQSADAFALLLVSSHLSIIRLASVLAEKENLQLSWQLGITLHFITNYRIDYNN